MSRGRKDKYQQCSTDSAGIPASRTEMKMCRSEIPNAAFQRNNGFVCDENGCRHREILRHTLADAIEVLESTRKAFKSRQIEALRKKLTRVLIEEA